MAIVRATESPRFDLPGVHFFWLLAPGRGSTELCTWRAASGWQAYRFAHRKRKDCRRLNAMIISLYTFAPYKRSDNACGSQ